MLALLYSKSDMVEVIKEAEIEWTEIWHHVNESAGISYLKLVSQYFVFFVFPIISFKLNLCI